MLHNRTWSKDQEITHLWPPLLWSRNDSHRSPHRWNQENYWPLLNWDQDTIDLWPPPLEKKKNCSVERHADIIFALSQINHTCIDITSRLKSPMSLILFFYLLLWSCEPWMISFCTETSIMHRPYPLGSLPRIPGTHIRVSFSKCPLLLFYTMTNCTWVLDR